MNRVLYAVGLADDDVKRIGEDNDLGVSISVIESVKEVIQELTGDPYRYSYVIICIKAFYETGGLDMKESFEALAQIIIKSPNTKFCILDENRSNADNYTMTCSPIPNVTYTSIAKIQLRTFKTVLTSFLNSSSGKPKQPKVEDNRPARTLSDRTIEKPAQKKPEKLQEQRKEPVKETQDTKQKWNLFKKEPAKPEVKLEPASKPVVEAPVAEQLLEEIVPQKPTIVERVIKPEPRVEEPQKEYEQQPVKASKAVYSSAVDYEYYRHKSILVTELTSCGSTMLSLMIAKNLADSGMKVCYVEVSKLLPSSNAVFSSDEIMSTSVKNILTAVATDTTTVNYMDYIGIHNGIHIIRDEILAERTFTISNFVKMIGVLSQIFDTVIYDIDSTAIMDYSVAVSMMSEKIVVLTNSYFDILQAAVRLKEFSDDKDERAYALFTMLIHNSKIVINKFLQGQSDMENGTIAASDVPSLIADIDEELEPFEILDLVGTIPISNDVVFNPFSKKAYSLTNEILKNIGS